MEELSNSTPPSQELPGVIVTPSAVKLGMATFAAVALATTRQESLITTIDLRDTLPEPWDVSDHIANTMWTIGVTGAALHFVSHRMAARNDAIKLDRGYAFEINTQEQFTARKHKLAATAAVLAMSMNLFSERSAFNAGTYTADGTDIAYGLLGGLLAYASTKPGFLDSRECDAFFATLPDQNRIKQQYLGAQPKALKDQVHDTRSKQFKKSSKNYHNPRGKRKT